MSAATPTQELEPMDDLLTGVREDVAPPADENPCPHCGAPRPDSHQLICKRCGFYEKLGICVDLDPAEREDAALQLKPEPTHWWQLVPFWAWIVGAGALAIVGESVAARFLTEPGSTARTVWSLTQLFVGFGVFVTVHLVTYLYAIMEDDRLQMLDVILKPLAVWERTINSLPGTWKRVAAGVWGWLAATLAVSLIGGIPYERLFDWGIKERPKKNLVQAIAQNAQQTEGGADNLEDAVKDFTGEAGVEDEQKALKMLPPLDCVVLGYVPDIDNRTGEVVDIQSFALAAEVKGKLRYVGMVSVLSLPIEERRLLLGQMERARRDRPLVRCDQAARWLEPRFSCRVRYKNWTSTDKLNDPRFEMMLADLNVPTKPAKP
jgi:hypothetical protein